MDEAWVVPAHLLKRSDINHITRPSGSTRLNAAAGDPGK